VNLRIKTDIMDLKSEDYYHDKSNKAFDLNRDIIITEDYIIDNLYKNNFIYYDQLIFLNESKNNFFNNEYFLIKSVENEKKSALVRFIKDNGSTGIFKVIKSAVPLFSVMPTNYKQKFLVDALLDPNIKVVFAIGIAGTGKTLLSISAGLTSIFNKEFKKLVVTRSPVPMGRDIGYLPGRIIEKMDPWLNLFMII